MHLSDVSSQKSGAATSDGGLGAANRPPITAEGSNYELVSQNIQGNAGHLNNPDQPYNPNHYVQESKSLLGRKNEKLKPA